MQRDESPAPTSSRDAASPWLVADIGGTQARFSLARLDPASATDGVAELSHSRGLRVREFGSLAEAARAYLRAVPPASRPRHAVLAVASAVTGDQVEFTNSDWTFSTAALRVALDLDGLHVLNDFAAVAWALPALHARDVAAVGTAHEPLADGHGVRVVLGPGTGLGVGAIKSTPAGDVVLETEGGHVGFAPRDGQEQAILAFLMRRYGRVSYERLLCGEGLLNVYQALCEQRGAHAALASPEQVSAAARDGDALARSATRCFCSVFGAFAGDTALMYGAWRGVYLAGGMLAHVFDGEGAAAFRAGFESKGRMAELLRRTPTLHITRDDVGSLGAAVYAARLPRARA